MTTSTSAHGFCARLRIVPVPSGWRNIGRRADGRAHVDLDRDGGRAVRASVAVKSNVWAPISLGERRPAEHAHAGRRLRHHRRALQREIRMHAVLDLLAESSLASIITTSSLPTVATWSLRPWICGGEPPPQAASTSRAAPRRIAAVYSVNASSVNLFDVVSITSNESFARCVGNIDAHACCRRSGGLGRVEEGRCGV